uniref:hypothetical protein n=1 Tax=Coprococcus catus TaxID=116085 RepID=UPI0022E250BD|nr:hypothetical protein [Coprococcus catus]
MAYREGLELRVRKQLGFAFRDISEHLPGAFIIYRADKEDDELLCKSGVSSYDRV